MARTARSGPRPHEAPDAVSADLEVSDAELLLRLTGPNGRHLRALEQEYGVSAGIRGHTILLRGPAEEVDEAVRGLAEVLGQLEKGKEMSERDVLRAVRTLRRNPEVKLADFMDEPILEAPRKTIVPKGVAQHEYVRAIRDNDVVFGIGPAGTGKTYLAMAMAVRALTESRVKRIILTRPAVEAGEKLGFLPGDLAEKVNPYLRPLYDALHDMMDLERAEMLMSRGAVEVAPLAFMRGRTLNDSFVILDEAQNSTSEQMKMFLTRLGFGSKAVITGDVTQTDLPTGRRSGLADAADLLSAIDGIRFCYFTDADVVRHPLVARIVRAYDRREEARQQARDAEVEAGETDDE
ncbi:MAG TPA: PhoH family protein [Sandaracinaceae bacterium LLY-WYZ-13_1]|nr:PhoH family protein [Sandaracinaceae bacterium LLY-WYZ-13_1]